MLRLFFGITCLIRYLYGAGISKTTYQEQFNKICNFWIYNLFNNSTKKRQITKFPVYLYSISY